MKKSAEIFLENLSQGWVWGPCSEAIFLFVLISFGSILDFWKFHRCRRRTFVLKIFRENVSKLVESELKVAAPSTLESRFAEIFNFIFPILDPFYLRFTALIRLLEASKVMFLILSHFHLNLNICQNHPDSTCIFLLLFAAFSCSFYGIIV